MSFDYRVISLPDVWPGEPTLPIYRRRSPFKTSWAKTTDMLDRETVKLNASDITIALDVHAGMMRQDGTLRADARPGPPVILAFKSYGDLLQFPCDTFAWWQDEGDA